MIERFSQLQKRIALRSRLIVLGCSLFRDRLSNRSFSAEPGVSGRTPPPG